MPSIKMNIAQYKDEVCPRDLGKCKLTDFKNKKRQFSDLQMAIEIHTQFILSKYCVTYYK